MHIKTLLINVNIKQNAIKSKFSLDIVYYYRSTYYIIIHYKNNHYREFNFLDLQNVQKHVSKY